MEEEIGDWKLLAEDLVAEVSDNVEKRIRHDDMFSKAEEKALLEELVDAFQYAKDKQKGYQLDSQIFILSVSRERVLDYSVYDYLHTHIQLVVGWVMVENKLVLSRGVVSTVTVVAQHIVEMISSVVLLRSKDTHR